MMKSILNIKIDTFNDKFIFRIKLIFSKSTLWKIQCVCNNSMAGYVFQPELGKELASGSAA